MVTATLLETEDYLLPPVLPAYLIRRRDSYQFKPRASADSPSSSQGPGTQARHTDASSSSSQDSSSLSSIRIPRTPSKATVKISLGIGASTTALLWGGCPPGHAASFWPWGRGPSSGSNGKAGGAGQDSKRVLIMMSNTGGGHRASAEALKAAFQELYGDKYEIDIVDMWKEHTPSPFNRLPDSYSFMVRHSLLWRLTYEITQPKLFHLPYLTTVGMFCRRGVSQAMDKYKPDLVVSVHPLMQHIPIGVLRNRIASGTQKPTNFATVVTDFTTCHNTWFAPGVTRCFVPTEFCRKLGKRQGLKDGQLVMHGLPIRPIFSKKLPHRISLRRQLGMDLYLPSVLLVGGGEGMGKLEATVDQIAAQLGNTCQVVVICGRNRKLLDKLKAKKYAAGTKVLPIGFVDNMHEWMAACDCIITKAGPGTIAEALISGLPILLNGNIPCQEEGNIPYVIENNVGAFETKPEKIAAQLKEWLSEKKEEFAAMAKRAKELGRPEAVYKIVQDLAQLADEPDFKFGPATAIKRRGKALKAVAA